MVDYYLNAAANDVKLEIFDRQQNLVRRFSSQDRISTKHPPVPIAERWLGKPEVLGKTAGMHRFVWNFIWGNSAETEEDEEADYRNPSGPRVVPGIYQIRLMVDGQSQAQPLQIVMDPRSPATADVLAQQFQLGKQIFMETVETRRALADIGSVQKRLADVEQGVAAHDPQLDSTLKEAQSALKKIVDGADGNPEQEPGLSNAYKDLASALRAVESGDRATPAQAVAVYQQSSQQIKHCMREWNDFREKQLPQINARLRRANVAPITVGGSE
jgi:hypothetical protein